MVDTAKLLQALSKIKDARAKLSAEFEAQDNELSIKQDKVEQALLAMAKETGLDTFSKTIGNVKYTATRVIKERVWPADWDAFREFEQANPEWDFRERRVHQKNFSEFIKQHPEATPPVNVDRKYAITLRRTKQ